MGQDWKNDRAEGEMQAAERENMKKSAEAMKTKLASEKTIKTISIDVNARESAMVVCEDDKGVVLCESNGYLPNWIHGYDYGNFVLEIDNETGRILNWVPLTLDKINKTEE